MIDFLVIGAPKCGTKSFYRYLAQHPRIEPAVKETLHYFDAHYREGREWYARHFPARPPAPAEDAPLTGEATSFYLFHPMVPQRVKETAPNAKFFVLLRDPTERTYLHFRDSVDKRKEHLSFNNAVKIEAKRLERGRHTLEVDPFHEWQSARDYAYTALGLYAEQLRRWFQVFPPDRFQIIKSEDYFADPLPIVHEAYRFLGLEPFEATNMDPPYINPYATLTGLTRRQVEKYFERYNHDLYRLLRRDFAWAEAD
ncbi:MAG TPA: sulfotransferase [Kiritimatiellia bacterium]|nr:sulfotransferase [Kiritimatiellia bacterium]